MGNFVRHSRVSVAALAAAVLLACTGVTALVFQPVSVSAEGLEPVPADVTLRPGSTVEKSETKPMVGSAEVRPDPDGCRNNPAIGLTCVVLRIKIAEKRAGYFLRITTTWLSQGQDLGTSVPDVDTYLFDQPTAYMDYNTIGGVSGANPEVIKVVDPKQDEYDYVLGVYAGAIAEYKVVVQYTNEAAGPSPAAPDIELSPKAPPVIKEVNTPMVGYTGQPAFYALVKQKPDACRDDPATDLLCDVYRLKLNRNKTREATNFVVITLEYVSRQITPDLVLGVAGLEALNDPNLDMFLWDSSEHSLERGQVGGETGLPPERLAFVATQDEYDLVVQIANGANTKYTLKAFMSDEIFDKPFELLDPITGQPISAPIPDGEGGLIDRTDGSTVVPPLELAPIDVDDQIAGIGLGTQEQFDDEDLLRLGRSAIRNTAAASEPPSALILWLALLVAPATVFGFGVVMMRRRHNEAF